MLIKLKETIIVLKNDFIFNIKPTLLEIINASLEELLLMATRHVDADAVIYDAFRMAHLAEYATVRAGDAFDGAGGAVGIPRHFGGGLAVEVAVLECNLSVGGERCNLFRRRNKATFAVRDRNGVDIAWLDIHEPWREVGGYDRVNRRSGMATNCIERQC